MFITAVDLFMQNVCKVVGNKYLSLALFVLEGLLSWYQKDLNKNTYDDALLCVASDDG